MSSVFGDKIKIKKISTNDVKAKIINAAFSERKREPILLNNTIDEIPQMFVNCLANDTYIRPHKHPQQHQMEQFSIIHGEATVLLFNDDGLVTDKFNLSHNDIVLVEIPNNIFHTVFTNTGCAFLEIRNHAYKQDVDKVYPNWSASENSLNASIYYKKLTKVNKGDYCVIE